MEVQLYDFWNKLKNIEVQILDSYNNPNWAQFMVFQMVYSFLRTFFEIARIIKGTQIARSQALEVCVLNSAWKSNHNGGSKYANWYISMFVCLCVLQFCLFTVSAHDTVFWNQVEIPMIMMVSNVKQIRFYIVCPIHVFVKLACLGSMCV